MKQEVQMILKLPREVHTNFKMSAAKRHMTMKELFIMAIVEFLRKEKEYK